MESGYNLVKLLDPLLGRPHLPGADFIMRAIFLGNAIENESENKMICM